MANLVIVESPAKANTIKGYLGSNYKVIASKGHIRDLPKSTLGIDVEGGFKPHYINIRGKGDVIKELKKEAKSANKVFLATDPDREGEAISWHIANQLGIPSDSECRVTFNEITKNAVKASIKKPRKIDEDLVNSQQARRILDRLVGFNVSELLWKSIKSGLSAGRVQSVATRIITEREEEIRAFVPGEYWTIDANLKTSGGDDVLAHFHGNKKGKLKVSDGKSASEITEKIKKGVFRVVSLKHSEKHRLPAPPFTTSTLQQEGSKKLGFQTQKIMKVAQELYDGLNLGQEFGGVQGLITYMRTDSLRISETAQAAALEFIKNTYGEDLLPKTPRIYKSNSNSQDAHEAIRPSNVNIRPDLIRKMLTPDQYKLYKLIWERFIASQMQSAVLDTVAVDIENSGYIFKAGGYIVKFKGYMSIYDNTSDDAAETEVNLSYLPNVRDDEVFASADVKAEQRFTEPPARYTEASLIKFLEENGIGRPSTYVPIITIIIARNYVRRDGKSLVATPLGELITKFMREHFPDIINYEFTASMESKLDSIESGENSLTGVISDFYKEFERSLSDAEKAIKDAPKLVPEYEESDIECDKCGAKMVYKTGRFGRFLACPNYPACKNTKALGKDGLPLEEKQKDNVLAGFKCEVCGSDMIVRSGRYGEFYACIDYPKCKFTKRKVLETGVPCPKCAGKILGRYGRGKSLFFSCENYPECDFSSWDRPLIEKCPDCGDMLFYKKSKKFVLCKNKGCGYSRNEEITETE